MTTEVDVPLVRERFSAAHMLGTVQLIDFLVSEKGSQILEIGSSSIGPLGLGKLYLGTPPSKKHPERPVRKPIEDLADLSLKLESFKPEELVLFDGVLGEFARVSTGPRGKPFILEGL